MMIYQRKMVVDSTNKQWRFNQQKWGISHDLVSQKGGF
jgi:hypothetical protein